MTTTATTETRVVQARQKGVTGYISIGRPGRWGNSYRVGQRNPLTGEERPLSEVLDVYERDLRSRLDTDPAFRSAFLALRGQTLGCPCTGAACDPAEGERCHGHVMVRVLKEMGEV